MGGRQVREKGVKEERGGKKREEKGVIVQVRAPDVLNLDGNSATIPGLYTTSATELPHSVTSLFLCAYFPVYIRNLWKNQDHILFIWRVSTMQGTMSSLLSVFKTLTIVQCLLQSS